MSDPSKSSSMGDVFRQRRAAAAAASASSASSSSNNKNSGSRLTPITSHSSKPASGFGSNAAEGSASGGGGRNSFAEIQREQELLSKQQQQQQGSQISQRYQSSNTAHNQYQQRGVQQQQQPMTDEYGRLVRPTGSSPRGNNAASRGGEYTRDNSRGGGDRYNNSNTSSNTRHSGTATTTNRSSSRHNNNDSDFKSSLPTEQGVIHTLLDKFGFIQCADRPKELFFHYSEYVSGHSDTLNIGDEVEFKIGMAEDRRGGSGGGEKGKWSAYNVTLLPKGTIYWEKEDEPIGERRRGVIESVAVKGVRGNNRNSIASVEGLIYLVNDDKEESSGEDDKKMEIYWTFSDYSTKSNNNKPSGSGGRNSSSSLPRLDKKDIAEFTLVTERRTGKKYARNITLVQSERERQRIEYETKLLQNATLERGKVVSNNGDFGFLKSVNRKEDIYFHVSHIILPEDNDDSDASSLLKEGQDVEFYVVNECSSSASSGGGGRGKKGVKSLSARKIKLLPKGSVKFEKVIAQGVTGIVVDCPVQSVMEPFGGNSRSGGVYVERRKSDMGKIRLQQEIIVKVNDDDDGEEQVITEVMLHPDMYPGGTFAISRTGSEVGCWIRPGDILLFDVVRKIADGVCHATPTKFVRPGDGSSMSVVEDKALSSAKPRIHLIETSLCGRAQGIVRSIHDDNYGFIQLAERSVDAYFPLFEVFPSEIQKDLVRNNPDLPVTKGRVQIEVGMEVEFDLSLQMLTNAGGGRGGGGGRYKQNSRSYEKESLRGRRVQILPKGSVKDKVEIAYGVKASVTRVDPKQPFVGTIELEDSMKVEIYDKRHPLVARLLDDILAGRYGSEDVIFHDVLSEKDAQVVISMVNAKDDLYWSYVPENADGHSRKLCITVKRQSSESEEHKEEGSDPIENPAVETSTTTTTTEDTNEASDKKQDVVSGGKKKGGADGKKGKKTNKAIKSLRFDKNSFPDITIGPLGVGDVVTCDIFQSRKSGAFLVENIAVIERKERPVVVVSDNEDGSKQNQTKKSLSGFVSEVVPSRQFGFITAVNNEGARTGEHVFFHFKDVESSSAENVAQGGKKFAKRQDPVTKGDEVKFDAGTGKNGKLSATNITILPRGTLKMPTKANNTSSSSCTGYILIEPSHTTLANTPAHVVTQSGPAAAGAGGRWANVRDDKSNGKSGSNIQEGGVILLLSDPSNLFSPKPTMSSPIKKTNSTEGSEASQKVAAEEAKTTDEVAPAVAESDVDKSETKDVENSTQSAVGTHIRYKLSSVASRGYSNGRSDGPKRGDLVSFGKTKGVNLVKDIRVEKAAAATSLRGTLTDINIDNDTAVFVSLMENNETKKYEINLTEVVSCDKKMLKDQEQVDGVLYEGKIYGGRCLHFSSFCSY